MPTRTPKGAGDEASSDVSKRRVTTPVLLQMHASECGAACLGIVLAYFGDGCRLPNCARNAR